MNNYKLDLVINAAYYQPQRDVKLITRRVRRARKGKNHYISLRALSESILLCYLIAVNTAYFYAKSRRFWHI